MAKQKIVTADDLELGKMTLSPEGTTVRFEARYVFLDAGDAVISNLTGKRVIVQDEQINLPANIQTAITDINTWLYDLALVQEGMD